jgi:hypothetical protein
MKRSLIIIIGLLMFAVLGAQTSGTTYTLPTNVTSYTAFSLSHTGDWDATSLKDSIGGTATKYWTFNINKSNLYYYQFYVEYDTVLTSARTVGNHVTVSLQGSIDGTTFVTVDSTLFHPTTSWLPAVQTVTAARAAEGVMNLKDVSTGVLWKYLRISATGGDASTCSLITKIMVKVGLKN